jgi:preprotein translocase subunit SecG
MLETLIWIVHVLAALAVIGLVLIQHGKGADVGAAFGSGSAGSLFGSSGAANFLSRSTAVLAGVFFVTSLGLSYLSGHNARGSSVMQAPRTEGKAAPAAPAVPAAAPAKPAAPGAAGGADSKSKDIPK